MTGFHMQAEDRSVKQMNDQPSGNLPFLKPDDIQYFDKLLVRILKENYMELQIHQNHVCPVMTYTFCYHLCLG